MENPIISAVRLAGIIFGILVNILYKMLIGWAKSHSSNHNLIIGVSENESVEATTKVVIFVFLICGIWLALSMIVFGPLIPEGTESVFGYPLEGKTVNFINGFTVPVTSLTTLYYLWFLQRMNKRLETDIIQKNKRDDLFK